MTEVKLVACAKGHRSTVPVDAVMTETASAHRCPVCGGGVNRANYETTTENKEVPFVGKSAWEKLF